MLKFLSCKTDLVLFNNGSVFQGEKKVIDYVNLVDMYSCRIVFQRNVLMAAVSRVYAISQVQFL